MADAGPTLLDLMNLLSDLHPRHLMSIKACTIRQLRLVSKEMASLASTAVTSCVVHFGEGGGSPSPRQLVKLFPGSQLQCLKIIVTVVTSGGFTM